MFQMTNEEHEATMAALVAAKVNGVADLPAGINDAWLLAWLDAWQACDGKTLTLDDGRPGGYDWPAIAAAARNGRSLALGIPRFLLAAAAGVNLGLAGLFGYAPMLTPGKVRELTQPDWLCDNSAISRATGWAPAIDLDQGIRQLMEEA